MNGTASTVVRLQSWKEIAAYLGVGVRTAQMWERDRGLPVHRLPGPRGPVYADIAALEAWRTQASVQPVTADGMGQLRPEGQWHGHWWRGGVALLALLTGLALAAAVWPRDPGMSVGVPVVLTSLPGIESGPDPGPDGRVAFVAAEQDSASVYVQGIGGSPQRLLSGVTPFCFPRWSPDGTLIACTRNTPDGVALVLVPVGGGAVRVLRDLQGADRQTDLLGNLLVSWLPDGSGLVLADRAATGAPFRLVRLLLSGEQVVLTTPPATSAGDVQPSVSPDGRVIAFARYSSLSEADVYTLDVRTGGIVRVTRDAHAIRGIAWAGNDQLVWSSDRAGRVPSLWTTSIHGGSPALLFGAEGASKYPSIRGSRLVYQFGTRDVNNWCSDRPAPVAASTAADDNPSLSADGLRLAFVSRRSGNPEVWMSRSDGARPEQLTHLAGGYTDSPRWSPDGAHLAFTSVHQGNRDVMLLRLADRAVWNLTRHPSDEGRPSWSPDGQTLYFRSDRSGTQQLWRQPIDGGPARRITTRGAYEPIADGAYVYYVRAREEQGVWRTTPDGGSEEPVVPQGREGRWTITNNTIYTLTERTITAWSLDTRTPRNILTIPGDKPLRAGFTAQPPVFCWTQIDQDTSDVYTAQVTRQ